MPYSGRSPSGHSFPLFTSPGLGCNVICADLSGAECSSPATMKLKASNEILEIYRSNKQRLALEMAKPVKDKACLNSIEAYKHIVSHLEMAYNLAGI